MMIRAAFLDRDGVINRDDGYVYRIEAFELIPGAANAMKRLQDAGYALVVVTNQSGIARGYFSQADFDALTVHMRDQLRREGVHLTGVYYCPHLPDAAVDAYRRVCDCRKPGAGMLRQAIADFSIDPARSIMIGDKPSDITAGRLAGIGRCLGVAWSDSEPIGEADAVYPDLAACVTALLD